MEKLIYLVWDRPSVNGGDRRGDLLGRVGLADRSGDPVSKLSGGEMQRVAICRALLRSPTEIEASGAGARSRSRLARLSGSSRARRCATSNSVKNRRARSSRRRRSC